MTLNNLKQIIAILGRYSTMEAPAEVEADHDALYIEYTGTLSETDWAALSELIAVNLCNTYCDYLEITQDDQFKHVEFFI